MRYATVCSGIEGVSIAWEPLGFTPVFFSEIRAFPKAVLAYHFPNVPDLGDLTAIAMGKDWKGKLDIIWGSTPCQSFSLAGDRQGTVDQRGALALSFCDLVDEIDPPIVCWENVKGVLSDGKNAFGCLLARLAGEDEELIPAGKKWSNAGCVFGPRRTIAWRVFDAQYGGVPQRRERVFLVACSRNGPDPTAILFEERSSEKFARTSGNRGTSRDCSAELARSVAFRGRDGRTRCEVGGAVANCLLASQGGSDKPFVLIQDDHPHIRQLTPLECERLMGMADGWTDIPMGNRRSSDAVRYHAIGNSLAVPDVRWIGQQIVRACALKS